VLKKSLFIFLLSLVFPLLASAHGSGLFIEKAVGEYVFDIGYSSDFIADDFIRFDLSLLKGVDKTPIPFSDAWVRISQGEKLLFAGPIAYGEFGKPGFSFVFPEAGDYTLSIRFEDSLKSLSEASVPIQVKPSAESGKSLPFALPVGTLILGALIGFLVATYIKKHA
jgi:hypothetical protein